MQALRMQACAAILAISVSCQADASKRDTRQRAEFYRSNPCPDNGRTRGPCPGFEVDHVVSLCKGGTDTPDNMQWLPVAAHRMKTAGDVKACRLTR